MPIYNFIMFLCYLSNRNKKRRRKKETLPTIRDLFFCNLPFLFCCFDPNLTPFFPISNIPYVPPTWNQILFIWLPSRKVFLIKFSNNQLKKAIYWQNNIGQVFEDFFLLVHTFLIKNLVKILSQINKKLTLVLIL